MKGKKIKKFIWRAMLIFLAVSILSVLTFRFVPVPITTTMILNNLRSDQDLKKEWVSYEEVSPNVVLALIAAEDQKFPDHHGFDLDGMRAAYNSNQNGGVVRGGSTISQQVAKNVFLWQHKSYIRKGLEAYFTMLIELFWSKERILEVYLNVAQTGENTFGVESASRQYFNKSAQDLSRDEAARLIQILPNPKRYSTNSNTKTRHILRQMNNLGSSYLKKIE